VEQRQSGFSAQNSAAAEKVAAIKAPQRRGACRRFELLIAAAGLTAHSLKIAAG
jgi:hypothetical protein